MMVTSAYDLEALPLTPRLLTELLHRGSRRVRANSSPEQLQQSA